MPYSSWTKWLLRPSFAVAGARNSPGRFLAPFLGGGQPLALATVAMSPEGCSASGSRLADDPKTSPRARVPLGAPGQLPATGAIASKGIPGQGLPQGRDYDTGHELWLGEGWKQGLNHSDG